jgi:sugar phosphate isomerase/epimerase
MKLCAFADEASQEISGQIAALKRNGYDYLEIRGVNGKNVSKISCDEAKEVKKMLDDAGLAVWSMGSPIGKHHMERDFSAHLDDLKRVVELSYIFGTNKIRMFSFHAIPGEDEATTRERTMEHLGILCDNTPKDIILCHENEKRIYGETAEKCLEVMKEFPRIRAVFDPANFVQCGVDTLKAWEMLKDHVEYLHIKDALADGTVVPAGQGIGNVEQIIKLYAERGGEVLTLEPHLQDFVGLSGLENGESVKHMDIKYKDNDESFDAGVAALGSILARI